MATEIFPFQSEIVPPKSIQLRKQSMEIPHFLWKSSDDGVDTVQGTAVYKDRRCVGLRHLCKFLAQI